MNPKVILLVEDNPSDIELTRRAFRKSHIANQLVVAEDGKQALAYLFGPDGHGNGQALPAVVLLDLNLPIISGLDVLRRIRAEERTRRLPVVILTTSEEERDVAAGYDLGANSYIRKPVDFAQFLQAIQQLELYWLVLNEQPPR